MTTDAAPHRQSISALLDAPLDGADTFRSKVTTAPWETTPSAPAPAAESRLLTIAEAAEVVPLSVKQLYRVAARPDGPFRKVERRLMAYEADLHRWIREHPTGGGEAPAPADGDSFSDRVRRRRKGGAS